MRTLLDNYPCFRPLPQILSRIEESGIDVLQTRNLPIISGQVLSSQFIDTPVIMTFLLDTGADISGFSPVARAKIQDAVKTQLDPHRAVKVLNDDHSFQAKPSYDMRIILPGNEVLHCPNGLTCFTSSIFAFSDGIIGQDILSELFVNFNGPEGTVTIIDPRG